MPTICVKHKPQKKWLLNKHIEKCFVGCAEGLDGTLVNVAVLVIRLNCKGVTCNYLTGSIILDLKGLYNKLRSHSVAEHDIQNRVAALVGGNDSNLDVL